jgi:hypothetical protein
MVEKLSKRKTSRLVVETYLAAAAPFKGVLAEVLDKAKSEFSRRRAAEESAPEHIRVIRRFGVTGVLRGYADADISALIAAEELAAREKRSPGDFVSGRSFAAGQANSDGKRESYDHEEILREAQRIGYFTLPPYHRKRRGKRLEIVKNLNLREGNPATSDDSWNRTMAKILDTSKLGI